MTIREKIGKCPLWKVALALLLIFTFLIAGIEEIFVSRVFSVMGKMITAFEKEKKNEDDEWDKEGKRLEKFRSEWKQNFDEAWNRQEEESKKRQQISYCRDYLRIKKIKAYLREPPSNSKEYIIRSWDKDERERLKKEIEPQHVTWLEDAAKEKLFDPLACKEDM